MGYRSLKFGDVKAESKGVMHNNIAKKRSKSLVIPTGKTTNRMTFKFFQIATILLLKVDHFEGILNWIKIDGMVNDHISSCNCSDLKTST